MKSLLEAIQKYPDQFISTLCARAKTTPSEENKRNHILLATYIADKSGTR